MMVRVAILLLTIAPQVWSFDVGSVSDEADSLLQGAYETAKKASSVDAPLEELEDKDDSHESLDETQLGAEEATEENQEGLDQTQHEKNEDTTAESEPETVDGIDDSLSQVQQLENLHEESKAESDEDLDETQLDALKPHKGDEMPKFPRSFPGCGCDWGEFDKTWSCKGTIALPASMQGKDCCCCTLDCSKSNRCTNEQCLVIGVDQKAEIDAEEARRAAALKGADALLGDLPVYKVSLGLGRPTALIIANACKKKDMTPLCDAENVQGVTSKECFHPSVQSVGEPPKKDVFDGGKRFSVPSQMLGAGLDARQFYGMCFFVGLRTAHGGCLFPQGMSHAWSKAAPSVVPIFDMNTKAKIQSIPISEIDNGKSLGGWHTYCTKKKPLLKPHLHR